MNITQDAAIKLIQQTNGRIFGVGFTKKDGSHRDMVCRFGVTSHLKGGEQSYDPAEYDLVTVFDVQKKGYRMINKETITRVSVDGVEYNVV